VALPPDVVEALDVLNSVTNAPLARLAAISELRAELDRQELAAVLDAEARGTSWQRIGDALGISKQAAHRKFSLAAENTRERRSRSARVTAQDAAKAPEKEAPTAEHGRASISRRAGR
jgi:hypothetical protein